MLNKYLLSKGISFKILLAGTITAFTFAAQAQTSHITSNIKFAEKLVLQDLEKYGSEYGLVHLFKIESLGVANKKYNFNINYSKKFCWETEDNERLTCSVYKCSSIASVNSDAIVEFEPEGSRKKCILVPHSTTYESY